MQDLMLELCTAVFGLRHHKLLSHTAHTSKSKVQFLRMRTNYNLCGKEIHPQVVQYSPYTAVSFVTLCASNS